MQEVKMLALIFYIDNRHPLADQINLLYLPHCSVNISSFKAAILRGFSKSCHMVNSSNLEENLKIFPDIFKWPLLEPKIFIMHCECVGETYIWHQMM